MEHSNYLEDYPPMPIFSLISHPLCPFVQRAAIVLLEKQVPFNRMDVDLSNKAPWFLEISPTGKVPLLKIQADNGANDVLFESVAICEYLQETQLGASLYPDNPIIRAKHRAWIEFGSATLGDAWGYLNAQDHNTANLKAIAFKEKLAQLEKNLEDGPYFGGEAFGMVDAVFAPIFRYFDILEKDIEIALFEDFSKINSWRKSLSKRASVVAAVSSDYPILLRTHLKRQKALLIEKVEMS
jgi:glutathione S-transferase